MKIRFAPFGAILSVLAFFAWMSSGARSEPSATQVQGTLAASGHAPSNDVPVVEEQTVGSAVPCAIPLGWRIDRVDESFELTRAEARAALDEAATLWEDAVGVNLFSNESEGTLPVRLVYDDRQERTEEQSRLLENFNETSASLEAQRVEFEERNQRFEGTREQYHEDFLGLDQRVATLNDSIRYWNTRGGAPEKILSELGTSGRALDTQRESLRVREREIDELQQRLADDSERLDRELEAHRIEGELLRATYPVRRVESGTYREVIHTLDGNVISVTREIRIYRFEDMDDLVRVAVHELGHALGLAHSTAPGSVMREELGQPELSQGTPRIQPSDVEALRSVCSEL